MKKRDEQRAPIQDGDARPDQNLDGKKKQESPLASDKKKLTKERGSDVNTLEDYKDAK